MRHPISILIIRDPNDVIIYKGYLSTQYESERVSDAYDYDSDYYRFMGAIYTDINYSVEDVLNNQTKYGKLLEHHTRWVEVDPQNMDLSQAYFSLYENQNTDYLCMHHNSPIFFNVVQADNYAAVQTELIRGSCDIKIV